MYNKPLSIGKLIKRLRSVRSLSQENLSNLAKVDRRYLSDLENDRRNPSIEVITRLADFFEMSLSQFFTLAEKETQRFSIDDIREYLCINEYSEAIIFENPDYAYAFAGVSEDGRAIYSYPAMISSLIAEGMTEEEAVEFIDYNTLRAIPYLGEKAPIILYPIG